MRRISKARPTTQLELFRERPATLDWDQLPRDLQQRIRGLLARLLQAHRRAPRGREVGDE